MSEVASILELLTPLVRDARSNLNALQNAEDNARNRLDLLMQAEDIFLALAEED